MLFLEVLYISLTTIAILAGLQFLLFAITKLMIVPPPQIVYRDREVPVYHEPVQQHVQPQVFTQEVVEQEGTRDLNAEMAQKSKERESFEKELQARSIASSLQLDTTVPSGLQETRPA